MLVCVALALTALVAGFWYWGGRPRRAAAAFDPPPLRESAFLNSSVSVKYVGSAACRECHQDQHASHMRTPHSRALGEIDSYDPLPAGKARHELSGRMYEVAVEGARQIHREFIPTADGEPRLLDEFAPKYVMGSGNHAHTYLIDVDGFLTESPITWFSRKGGWKLSPGYSEMPDQPGFSRLVDSGCLDCHSGGVEPQGGSPYRLQIREAAIGCERCHGPGELHVAHRKKNADAPTPDLTIVNPARLDRARQESVCAVCHLEGATRIPIRDRRTLDFRPGRLLADFDAAFVLRSGNQPMHVVGHIEQMRLSPCYRSSKDLSCVTCHNPHERPSAPQERLQYFRQKCLDCHKVDACGLEQGERLRRDKDDNCNACHMPQSPTEITHVAFTHHRIGLHGAKQDPAPGAEEASKPRAVELSSLDDLSHLQKIDRDRCLGLGYFQLAADEADVEISNQYGERAKRIFEWIRQQGLNDPDVDAALGRLYQGTRRPKEAIELVRGALRSASISPNVRVSALEVMADAASDLQDHVVASEALSRLTELRRSADDWARLSIWRQAAGDSGGALEATKTAALIAPYRADLQANLAARYKEAGDSQRALIHARQAEQLEAAAKK